MTVSYEAIALRDGYDLDALTKPGVYMVTDPTNGPDTGDWYIHVFVAKFAGNARQFQLAWSDAGNTGSTRAFTGTAGWTVWSDIASGGAPDLSAVNDLVFLTSPTTPSQAEGSLYYDSTNKTLAVKNDASDITLQVGQENYIRVYNDTGSTITNGSVCYAISGEATEGRITIGLANASADNTSRVIGLATHDIATGTYGYVTQFGYVNDLDTSALTAGAAVWLSTTNGELTETPPSSPDNVVFIGFVTVSDVSSGVLFITTLGNTSGDAVAGETTQVIKEVRKASAGTLTAGTPVYIAGYNNGAGVVEVEAADADNAAAMPAMGVLEDTITSSVRGNVVLSGDIGGIDTSGFSVGDRLYVSTTAGVLTNVKPTATDELIQSVATVIRSNAGNGRILVSGAGRNTAAPNLITGAAIDASRRLQLSADISPAQLTANTNNWAPTGVDDANIIRLSTDAERTLSGIAAGGEDGRILGLMNIGSFNLIISNEDTNSTAANRFSLEGNITLRGGTGMLFIYDSTSSRWRPISPVQTSFQNVVLETFTASGTWTKDAGLVAVNVIVVGGGGAGGGAEATGASEASSGAGGSAGGIAIESLDAADLGATETVTIGAAGAAASGTTGGNGGTSSFGALCSATGGAGGTTTATGGTLDHAFPGSGGTGSGGDLNIRGSQGGIGESENGGSSYGGRGADSDYGGGGEIASTAATGGDAQGYGAGGGGAMNTSSLTAKSGGAGAPGIVIVAEYY